MKDKELDRLIARVNPYGDQTVAHLPTGGAEADLLEELMASATPTRKPGDDPGKPLIPIVDTGRPPRRPRRWLVPVAAAAATALVALTGVVVARLDTPAAPPADPAGMTIEANEWLLLDAPGWKIEYVAEVQKDSAEVRYTDGTRDFSIHWRSAGGYTDYYEDRADDGVVTKAEILGRPGTVFRYVYKEYPKVKTDMAAMLPPKGPTFLEIRADLGSEQAFHQMLGKLRPVDFKTWLDALPGSVVKPDQNAAVAAEMLTDMPLPPDFDRGQLDNGTIATRYHFAARVAGTVACGWMDQWGAAKRAGDTEGVRRALAALQSSKSWKVVQEMGTTGSYPEVLADIVAQITSGKVVPGPKTKPTTNANGTVGSPEQRTVGDLKAGFCP